MIVLSDNISDSSEYTNRFKQCHMLRSTGSTTKRGFFDDRKASFALWQKLLQNPLLPVCNKLPCTQLLLLLQSAASTHVMNSCMRACPRGLARRTSSSIPSQGHLHRQGHLHISVHLWPNKSLKHSQLNQCSSDNP